MTKKNTTTTKILILGAGALGSNLAANLAADLRNEVELTVLDYDKIEERNVTAGTQFYMPDQVGMSKGEALQYNLYKWFGVQAGFINEMLGDDNLRYLGEYDLVIDCFDNESSRERVQDARNTELTGDLLHCGFSPQMTFEITWDDRYEVPTDSPDGARDICEMPGARGFIQRVAGLAANAVRQYVEEGKQVDYLGNRNTAHKLA